MDILSGRYSSEAFPSLEELAPELDIVVVAVVVAAVVVVAVVVVAVAGLDLLCRQ